MAKKKTKAAGYLRRSTDKQEASIKEQRAKVIEYAKDHGYEIVCWYVDDGISGDDTENRLEFLRMREDAQGGAFQVILCWDQARFGRFDMVDAGHWIKPIRDAGVRLVTVVDGPIDWDDALVYMVNQQGKNRQLRDHSANVVRGQIESAKAGSWIGSVPYGFRLEGAKKKKRLIIGDKRQVAAVQRIFREFTQDGRSITSIAKGLEEDKVPRPGNNPWGFDAVKWMLQNVAYIGTFRCNVTSRSKYHSYRNGQITKGASSGRKDEADWIVIPNNHDAIVKQRTFDRAQAIIAKGRTARSPYTPEDNPYLLSGVLRCGKCNCGMVGTNNGKFRYYECSSRNRRRGCEGTTVKEEEVLMVLSEYVDREFISDDMQLALGRKANRCQLKESDLPEAFAKLKRLMVGKANRPADAKRLSRQLQQVDAMLADGRRNLTYAKNPKSLAAMEEELERLEEQQEELCRQIKDQPSEADINEMVLGVLNKLFGLLTLKPECVKPVVRELDRIVVHTRKHGSGSGTRHEFLRGEVVFKVGTVQGKLNPHCAD